MMNRRDFLSGLLAALVGAEVARAEEPGVYEDIRTAGLTWPVQTMGQHITQAYNQPAERPASETEHGMTRRDLLPSAVRIGAVKYPTGEVVGNDFRMSLQHWAKGGYQGIKFHSCTLHMLYVLSGVGIYLVGDYSYKVGRHTLIRVRPDEPHGWLSIIEDLDVLYIAFLQQPVLPEEVPEGNERVNLLAEWKEKVHREKGTWDIEDLGKIYDFIQGRPK